MKGSKAERCRVSGALPILVGSSPARDLEACIRPSALWVWLRLSLVSDPREKGKGGVVAFRPHIYKVDDRGRYLHPLMIEISET